MDAVKYLASKPEGLREYILYCHKEHREGTFTWSTELYKELKQLSPSELLEDLNEELLNG